MKVTMRKSVINDLDKIYNLHNLCFSFNDRWYKNSISQYIDNSIILENNNEIIGFLLQGNFKPVLDDEEFIKESEILVNEKELKNDVYSIVMICIHPNFRNKGLASKLIVQHIKLNQNKEILYLCTRITNTNAISCYLKNGYKSIGIIKNKYYLPIEDGNLMIYKNKK